MAVASQALHCKPLNFVLAIAITVKFQPGIAVYDAHINYFCHVSDVKHVQTYTRPSPFSACNIEKSGGPGDEARCLLCSSFYH